MISNCLLDQMFFLGAWMSDLLVVKHSHQNMSKVVNMELEDWTLVDLIVIKW